MSHMGRIQSLKLQQQFNLVLKKKRTMCEKIVLLPEEPSKQIKVRLELKQKNSIKQTFKDFSSTNLY